MRHIGLRQGARRGPLLALAAVGLTLAGCAGGSMFGEGSTLGNATSAVGDRFSQLFGSNSQEPGAAAPAAPEGELTCPSVSIRPGASTYAVGAPGKPASGNDLRYQATITRTARDCNLNAGQITVRIGIQGRLIVGPAGAPAAVDVPLRVAVVQEGVNPKTIATKVYQTNVQVGEETSVPFSLVGEDLVYPAPSAAAGDSYVFYIGFDPQALKPEPKARAKRR
ncbi:hypothetical protein [Tardiphaga sp.]|jgi:hypothetical protein|uniref:hypothetical protein n=1 Tax=Tardiphaga sp. TaxID=1926292 RepID=UPI00198F89A5|nr:hypothetical protein [Tardiphaga sp.]MBC7578079.1 hypothetical protein [Tardiphaga sp.]